MNERLIDCEELEMLLPLYLEGEADADERAIVERHAAVCARCSALLSDVNAIVRAAGELPTLTPSRDLWPEIESRIQPDVLPLSSARAEKETRVRRVSPRWTTARLAAAAAALVISTAGVTYVATTHVDAARNAIATGPAATGNAPGGEGTRSPTTPSGTARNASALSSEQLYDREIAHLQTIVHDRRSLLDTATIAVIQRNLAVIDSAIAQSRAALAADPNSRFLNEQLNSVLGQKVELLRTAALLPART
ncbi:MAG TPA: zf-HC2 domain-containing protein [Gemmatimonadaceae bacterium]|jgi:anti-sigma factor RsiW|nr:zf-HC2 domain-containing protein [Gemmatimonadaceae bacterium]